MQIKRLTWAVALTLLPLVTIAQSVYCPENQGYISIGMTEDQVIAACGQPLSKQDSNTPATQKIAVKQLIYNTINQGSIYPGLNNIYDQWSLTNGPAGVTLEVDIVNNKVNAVRINGSNSNAMSVCQGINVQVGDSENAVYEACGSPGIINNTFINQPVPSRQKPQIWVYQVNQYQTPMSLTFVNGQLQSIN